MSGLTLTIPGGCNGPPGSGHGGYVCGRLAGLWAARHGGPAAGTLLLPPPLEVALTVTDGASRMSLWHGQQLLATVAGAGRQPPVTPSAQGRLAGCASAVWTALVPEDPSVVPSQQTEPAGLRPVPTAASPAQE